MLVPLVMLVVVKIMFMEIVARLERLSVEEKKEAKGFATYFVFD